MISARILINVTRFLLLLRIFTVKAEPPLKDAPCNYKDTVRLDPIFKLKDGSYRYDDIIVPLNETGTYNYEIAVGNVRKTTEVHVRGCICKFRNCISICCPNDKEISGETCLANSFEVIKILNITTKLGTTVSVNVSNHFVNQIYKPCADMYSYVQGQELKYNYSLLENGSIYVNKTIKTKDEYCMNPVPVRSMLSYYPSECYAPNPPDSDTIIANGIVMLISVPFMLITIWVYMLQSITMLMIKSTCFYLISLSVGFTTLAMINFLKDPSNEVCSVLGYTTYFAFIASYSWVTVSSYDLFKNICENRDTYNEAKKFTFYSLFAWGLPISLLGFTLFAQKQNWDSKYKPNIGGRNNCFFEQHGNNKMIYLYGPGIILTSLNFIMYLLTVTKIKNGSIPNAMKRNKSKDFWEKCALFVRLYLLTGVAWILDFLSYCFPKTKTLQILLFILVECQGYLIFCLVVFKESSRNKLKEKYPKLFGRQSKQPNSSSQQNTIETTNFLNTN